MVSFINLGTSVLLKVSINAADVFLAFQNKSQYKNLSTTKEYIKILPSVIAFHQNTCKVSTSTWILDFCKCNSTNTLRTWRLSPNCRRNMKPPRVKIITFFLTRCSLNREDTQAQILSVWTMNQVSQISTQCAYLYRNAALIWKPPQNPSTSQLDKKRRVSVWVADRLLVGRNAGCTL